MLLNKQEQARLQELITHKDFDILVKFGEELKKSLGVATVYDPTQWDFIKGSLQKEFQISFIDEFFKLIEQEAYDKGPDHGEED